MKDLITYILIMLHSVIFLFAVLFLTEGKHILISYIVVGGLSVFIFLRWAHEIKKEF